MEFIGALALGWLALLAIDKLADLLQRLIDGRRR